MQNLTCHINKQNLDFWYKFVSSFRDARSHNFNKVRNNIFPIPSLTGRGIILQDLGFRSAPKHYTSIASAPSHGPSIIYIEQASILIS